MRRSEEELVGDEVDSDCRAEGTDKDALERVQVCIVVERVSQAEGYQKVEKKHENINAFYT